MNTAESSPLPVPADDRDLVSTGPVYDAELVDGPPPAVYYSPQLGRFTAWWLRSRRIPMWVKSRAQAKQAAKDALATVLRSPFRFLGAVVRGLVAAVRWWRQWVTVRDFHDAAEQAEKLADKFTEIRALTLFRWKVTGAVTVVAALGVAIAELIYGPRALWITTVIVSSGLAVLGRRRDGSPGRKAVLAGPRSLTWTMDPQVLVDAFRDAKLIGKDETLRLVERATHIGGGWAITVDLPPTRKATDVIKNREALASALAVDEVQLIVERVRGNGGHAGRVSMWVADSDPYASPPLRTPLLDVPRWDAWRPIPFGRDARNRAITLALVWTSLLIGAIPRQGKTFAARLAAAGLILDPFVRLYVADFKAGKDWGADDNGVLRGAALVAHRFLAGDEPEHIMSLVDWLVELIGEVQGRYKRMRQLDDVTCPESKVTPAMSRDPALNMPITTIVIDEVQVPLLDRTPITVDGRKLPAGEYVGELLTWLAKKGPAAGIVLILATQRPDSKTIPSGLRAVLGSRFALRVMDWRDSNIVLGEQMNTRGYDSSRLLASHKGVGILRSDGDTQAGADVLAVTVRTYYMPNDDWQTLCQRGRALREATGTLTGRAAGNEAAPVLDHAAVAKAIGAGSAPAPASADVVELPEPLASIVDYLETNSTSTTDATSSPPPNWPKHSTSTPQNSVSRCETSGAAPPGNASPSTTARSGRSAATSPPTSAPPSKPQAPANGPSDSSRWMPMTSDTRSVQPVTPVTTTPSHRHTRCAGRKSTVTCTNGSCDGCDGFQPTPSHPSQTAPGQRYGGPSAQPVTRGKGDPEPSYGSLVEHVGLMLASGEAPMRTPGFGLPLPPLSVPTSTLSLYYTVTPVDARGRLADRSPIRALGWRPGQPITITVTQQAVVVTTQASGAESITRQGHLRLPARIRHTCRLNPGDRLLTAAAPYPDVLVIYTMPLLESILVQHHAAAPSGEGPT